MNTEDIKRMTRAYQAVREGSELVESHFKVGDKVEYTAPDGGEYYGEVVKLDEPQTGAYYHVKLKNGKVVKAKSDQLEKEDDEDEEMKEALDPVNKKALKKDFKDREDKDIDNDGDIDKSDEYLHKRRKAVSKAVKGETATTNPKMKTSGASEQKEETEVEENYNWKVSHAGKHVYVKAPHAGVAVKKAQKGYGNMDLTKAKVKNLGKVGIPANEAVSTADKKPENYMEADGKMHTRMVPTKKDVVKKEGTIRDRLMSVLEKRDEHYKSATAPEPIDSKDSSNAKKMRKDHKPEVMADINKVSDDVAKATKSAKTSPKRPNDNTQGDKNIINPAQDVTKQGGFKESVMNIWNAYKSVVEKK